MINQFDREPLSLMEIIGIDKPKSVNTYADLPPAIDNIGEKYFVNTTTGSILLGNKKNAGAYISDGTTWQLLEQASYDDIDNAKANKTITITAGTGLTGGGDLSMNRVISHDATGSANSINNTNGNVIQSLTLDVFSGGHITGASSVNLDNRYILKNTAITGATKTKITYDSNGLITAGADATTDDIIEGTNQYFTQARARNSISVNSIGSSGVATYDALTGVIAVPNYGLGNSTTATALQNARLINGVSFDGTADITIFDNTKQPLNTNLTNIGAVSNSIGWLYNNGAGVFSYSSPTTSNVSEGTNLYYTNARAIASTLTGYVSGAGTISATDTILSAIQKLNGNIGDLTTGVSSVFGRTGDVVATEGDYNLNLLGDVNITTPTSGQVLKYNGTNWVNNSDTDTGITSLNGLTSLTQIFAIGTAGTNFNISSSTSTHTFNLPTASATNRGALSSTDWSTFNNKQNAITLTTTGNSGASSFINNALNIPNYTLAGLGGISLTSLSALTPLSYNNTTGAFSISQANSTTNGFLSSIDWNSFNNKQNALNGTGFVKASGTTISYDNNAYLPLSGGTITGQLISTRANDPTTNGGQISLRGTGGNRIDFSATAFADPTFTTRSVGTKITLWPSLSATTTDYAIGVANATIWVSLPDATTTSKFKVYGGTTETFSVDGAGNFAITGTATASQFIKSGGTSSQFLKADGTVDSTTYQPLNTNLTTIAALTPTNNNFIVGNGTAWTLETPTQARTSLGLGTIATQSASNVAITGGSITGITDLAIADGGTGASTQQGALNAIAGAVTSGQFLRGNGTNVIMSAIQAGDVPTLNQSTTGNAATATALQTARNINGVSFDGTADITVADSTKLPLTGGTLSGALQVNGNINSNNLLVQGTATHGYIRATAALSNLYLGTGSTNWLTLSSTGTLTSTSTIRATSFIKTGGLATEFLKADGSSDNTDYLPSANYTAADILAKLLTVDGVGSNLDADLLGGIPLANEATNFGPLFPSIPLIKAGTGVMEVGRYIDFHNTSNDGIDYAVRLDTGGTTTGLRINNSRIVTANSIGTYALPITGGTVSGTITATSFIKSNGTASEFLKADGSIDTNQYATTNSVRIQRFLGSLTNNTSISSSIEPIPYTTQIIDSTYFTNSSGNITINVAGTYEIICQGAAYHTNSSAGMTTEYAIRRTRSGTSTALSGCRARHIATTNSIQGSQSVYLSVITTLQVNDIIKILAYVADGASATANLQGGGTYNILSIKKLID